jgi:acetyl-CoA carboxylase biotin carboxylase subunit
MFKKVLIANRGEIAVRVIRACREMGITSVAVYSDVDRGSLHVSKADEAYPVGPAAAQESYLNVSRILEVAKRCGAEAIHPGYGFLSENAKFARACAEAGIKFIGPPPSAMELMGSKTRARTAMQAAGVPMVPGSARGLSLAEAEEMAVKVGFPVMIKAAAGGGGKGMRLVKTAAELKSSFETAQSEALRAFNDGEIYLEKFIEDPRHIEIQVLGDEHGNVVYLGERECSVQRRHQKVIEEAPSAIVDQEMRQRMGAVAVQAARSAGYTNAGTIEFLVDARRNFYFLEMNTRLQVEHPVTELVTGLDLVRLQIEIAAGAPLPFTQEQIAWRGAAIECRIYAEDPYNDFLPYPGTITRLTRPLGPGIRLDGCVYSGWTVPMEYDPLLAKLAVWADTRDHATARMLRALREYDVGGIRTNLAFFRQILEDPEFRAANLHTGFIDEFFQRRRSIEPSRDLAGVAALAAALHTVAGRPELANGSATSVSAWQTAGRDGLLR